MTAHHVAIPKERDGVAGSAEPLPGTVGHTAEFIIGPHSSLPGRFVARARATIVALGDFSGGSFEGAARD